MSTTKKVHKGKNEVGILARDVVQEQEKTMNF